jgi:hypothetical protein
VKYTPIPFDANKERNLTKTSLDAWDGAGDESVCWGAPRRPKNHRQTHPCSIISTTGNVAVFLHSGASVQHMALERELWIALLFLRSDRHRWPCTNYHQLRKWSEHGGVLKNQEMLSTSSINKHLNFRVSEPKLSIRHFAKKKWQSHSASSRMDCLVLV